jgi:hypothetical protein
MEREIIPFVLAPDQPLALVRAFGQRDVHKMRSILARGRSDDGRCDPVVFHILSDCLASEQGVLVPHIPRSTGQYQVIADAFPQLGMRLIATVQGPVAKRVLKAINKFHGPEAASQAIGDMYGLERPGNPSYELNDDRWYWLVTYEAYPTGGSTGPSPEFEVAVRMDGTVVRPVMHALE